MVSQSWACCVFFAPPRQQVRSLAALTPLLAALAAVGRLLARLQGGRLQGACRAGPTIGLPGQLAVLCATDMWLCVLLTVAGSACNGCAAVLAEKGRRSPRLWPVFFAGALALLAAWKASHVLALWFGPYAAMQGVSSFDSCAPFILKGAVRRWHGVREDTHALSRRVGHLVCASLASSATMLSLGLTGSAGSVLEERSAALPLENLVVALLLQGLGSDGWGAFLLWTPAAVGVLAPPAFGSLAAAVGSGEQAWGQACWCAVLGGTSFAGWRCAARVARLEGRACGEFTWVVWGTMQGVGAVVGSCLAWAPGTAGTWVLVGAGCAASTACVWRALPSFERG